MQFSSLIIISLATFLEGCRKSGDSSSSTDCCPDYYLRNGVCVDCPAGKFGPSCQFDYPKYGRRCLGGFCNCSIEACDPATGCREITTAELITSHEAMTSHTSSPRKVETTARTFKSTIDEKDVQSSTNGMRSERNRSEYSVTGNIKMDSEIIKDAQKSNEDSEDISLNIIIMSVIGGLVILLLIIVIIVLIRGKRKVKVEKRDSVENSRGHVNTYCEINDLRLPSTSQGCRRSDIGKYELIDQSEENMKRYSSLPTNSRSEHKRKSDAGKYEFIKTSDKERTKYSTLPSKPMTATNRDSYITPVSSAIQSTDAPGEDLPVLNDTNQGASVSPVILRKASTNRDPNLLAIPGPFAASKHVSGYIDMNKSEKLDEYVPMEGQINIRNNSDPSRCEEKHILIETYK
ncbi:uncharacterized protein LOC134242263 isoform X2 [Saccostrea cucullata]|uniref:uncharacterized protein LOC134242263 isoform X2 n=1 Tax=Saccostrea cuccullata TaxID=36930 RepID=UPI002ED20224